MNIHANRQSYSFGPYQLIEIRLLNYVERTYALPVVWKGASESMQIEPCFKLSDQEAQSIVDQLWECGIRPTQGSGSAGSLAATEKHLQDMKTVAFHALKIDQNSPRFDAKR